jgi:hypothetical protein
VTAGTNFWFIQRRLRDVEAVSYYYRGLTPVSIMFSCSFLFELQKLCDAVPGFPTPTAIEVIESELGARVTDLFCDLSPDTRSVRVIK